MSKKHLCVSKVTGLNCLECGKPTTHIDTPTCKHKARKSEPDGYIAWHEWAEKMSKTYKQVQCPKCKLYKDWIKK